MPYRFRRACRTRTLADVAAAAAAASQPQSEGRWRKTARGVNSQKRKRFTSRKKKLKSRNTHPPSLTVQNAKKVRNKSTRMKNEPSRSACFVSSPSPPQPTLTLLFPPASHQDRNIHRYISLLHEQPLISSPLRSFYSLLPFPFLFSINPVRLRYYFFPTHSLTAFIHCLP